MMCVLCCVVWLIMRKEKKRWNKVACALSFSLPVLFTDKLLLSFSLSTSNRSWRHYCLPLVGDDGCDDKDGVQRRSWRSHCSGVCKGGRGRESCCVLTVLYVTFVCMCLCATLVLLSFILFSYVSRILNIFSFLLFFCFNFFFYVFCSMWIPLITLSVVYLFF